MAERQGFEPWVPLQVQRISNPSRSSTPAPLRADLLLGFTHANPGVQGRLWIEVSTKRNRLRFETWE